MELLLPSQGFEIHSIHNTLTIALEWTVRKVVNPARLVYFQILTRPRLSRISIILLYPLAIYLIYSIPILRLHFNIHPYKKNAIYLPRFKMYTNKEASGLCRLSYLVACVIFDVHSLLVTTLNLVTTLYISWKLTLMYTLRWKLCSDPCNRYCGKWLPELE